MKNGNVSYIRKILGEETWFIDKIIFGYLIGGILLLLMVGPFIFFSDIGGFTAPNPVTAGDITIDFVISSRISDNDLASFGLLNTKVAGDSTFVTGSSLNKTSLDDGSSSSSTNTTGFNLQSKHPYMIYENKNPFIRQYDQSFLDDSNYVNWTETRFFNADQIQDCIASEYSDQSWGLAKDNIKNLGRDIQKSINQTDLNYNMSVQISYDFSRSHPDTALSAAATQNKTLNVS